MALTITKVKVANLGSAKAVVADLDFDSSYPTGGESLTPANLGLDTIDFLLAEPQDGLVYEYDYTNEKLIAYEQGFTTGSTTAADATSGTLVEDIAGTEGTFRAMGVAVDTDILFGKLKECAATTDLSGVTDVRVIAFGNFAGNEP